MKALVWMGKKKVEVQRVEHAVSAELAGQVAYGHAGHGVHSLTRLGRHESARRSAIRTSASASRPSNE